MTDRNALLQVIELWPPRPTWRTRPSWCSSRR